MYSLGEAHRFEGWALLRVVPGPNQIQVLGQAEIRLISAELYQDGVVLQWSTRPPQPPSEMLAAIAAQFDMPHDDPRIAQVSTLLRHAYPTFELEDDAGTRYKQVGGSGGGQPVLRGASWFAPAVPSDITHLRARARLRHHVTAESPAADTPTVLFRIEI